MPNGQPIVPAVATAKTTTSFSTTNTTTGEQIPGLIATLTLRRAWPRLAGRDVVAELWLPCFNATAGAAWEAVVYIDQIDPTYEIAVQRGSNNTAALPAYVRSGPLQRDVIGDGVHTFYAYLRAVTTGTAQMNADTTNPATLTVRELA